MYNDNEEFNTIIADLAQNNTVQQMKNYIQHCDTTCYEHCKNVAYYSYLICKKFNLDYKSAARGGMLHDLFLYNWRNSKKRLNLEKYHAFIHSKIALENSVKLFELNEIEKDIILKHMWPVTLFKLPKYHESYVITLVDKYCATKETIEYIQRKKNWSKLYRYANMFLLMILIHF